MIEYGVSSRPPSRSMDWAYLFNVTDSILTGWTFAKLHSVTYVRLLDKEKKQKFLQQLILEGDNTKYTAYT